jgi:hypothetical protein
VPDEDAWRWDSDCREQIVQRLCDATVVLRLRVDFGSTKATPIVRNDGSQPRKFGEYGRLFIKPGTSAGLQNERRLPRVPTLHAAN